jgi:hypothetical protein
MDVTMKYADVKNLKWANAEQTTIEGDVIFPAISGQHIPFSAVASGDAAHTHEIFARCLAGDFGAIAPYVVPTPDPAETLAAWRASAVASQAQIRLTLHQLGLLATVQAMADADPDASIVWEYADAIRRASPFIDALKGEAFTDAQIDDIFVYAMALVL